MLISTKGKYGLRAMIDIANSDKCISVKAIAERQGISESYLEQIFSHLKITGLIVSTRGAYGGYKLTKVPSEITVGEILRALEDLRPAECIGRPDSSCGDSNCKTCAAKGVWLKLHYSLNEVVDSITLEDLVNDFKVLLEIEEKNEIREENI